MTTAKTPYRSVLFVLTLYVLSDIALSANAYFSIHEPDHILDAPDHFFTIVGSIALAALLFATTFPRTVGESQALNAVCGVICGAVFGMSIAELAREKHVDSPPILLSLLKTLLSSTVGLTMAVVRLFQVSYLPEDQSQPRPIPIGSIRLWASILISLVYLDMLVTALFEHHIGRNDYVLGLSENGAIILLAYSAAFVALSIWFAFVTKSYRSSSNASRAQTFLATVFLAVSIFQTAKAEPNSTPMFAALRSIFTSFFFIIGIGQDALSKLGNPSDIALTHKINLHSH